MAKKAKVLPMSKSEAIRSFKEANPNVGPKSIAATLNEEGYNVTAQFVSTVLSNDRRKTGSGRTKSIEDLSVTDLKVAKELVRKLGGIENAKTALTAYSDLISQ